MASPRGSMTSELMLRYIDHVIAPAVGPLHQVGMLPGTFPVVIHDQHSSHISQSSLDRFFDKGLKPVALPGGSTSILQPLDLLINKSFKAHIKEQYGSFYLMIISN